jgi:hypothetical protein
MEKMILLDKPVVCCHCSCTGQWFVSRSEELVVVPRLCCALCSREVAESVVQRQTAAVPALEVYTIVETVTAEYRPIFSAYDFPACCSRVEDPHWPCSVIGEGSFVLCERDIRENPQQHRKVKCGIEGLSSIGH